MTPKIVRENCQNLVVKKSFSIYYIICMSCLYKKEI